MSRLAHAAGLLALALSTAPALASTAEEDASAIRRAVLNYANSVYELRPDLVEASVHPKLQKIGYVARRDGREGYRERWLNFYELRELVTWANRDGGFDPETARRDVRVLDQLDRTAVARLDAEWGIDYLQLAKLDGSWTIMNVLWQTYPPSETEAVAEAGPEAD